MYVPSIDDRLLAKNKKTKLMKAAIVTNLFHGITIQTYSTCSSSITKKPLYGGLRSCYFN